MATNVIDPADDFNDAAFGDAGGELPAPPKAVARRPAAPRATRAPRTRREAVPATPMPARPAGPSRLSTRLAVWMRESRWLLHLAIGLFLTLILATYDKGDPGWSHAAANAGANAGVKNAGGRFGAWLSDLLLYLFGLSVWWWVLLFAYFLYAGYRRLAHNTAFSAWAGNWLGRSKADDATLLDRRSLASLLPGFVLTLVASSALEALRLHSLKAALPYSPGGVLGELVSRPLAEFTGFTGGTLILLVAGLIGFSLFTGISWLDVAERIGAGIDWLIERTRRKAEERIDRKIGEEAIERREQVVEVERRELFTEHEPIKIEPVFIPVQSPRVEQEQIREKQAPLFNYSELPPDSPLPALSLLDPAPELVEVISPETVEFNSRLIEKKLKDFNVTVLVKAAYPGPVITRYEIEPATGVKGSQIVGLAKDLARALSLVSVRVVETIPGKSLMGLELPNPKRQIVRLSEILGSQVYNDSSSMLTLALGKDIAGKPVVADLAKMPHLLVAGTTGAGKSVAINAMILSLLYKAEADRVRLILIDPKMLEMSMYADIPHLLAPVVTDMKQATNALNWCVNEMERRYKLMSSQGVRNLAGFNAKVAEAKKAGKPLTNPFTLTPESPEPLEHMPMIVVVIDELADLMMVIGKKIEELIARLAQKARAAGVHLLLATQRPSVDVITGLIKANIPTRIAFQVSSKIDSRTILDQMGAEALLGQGDMLFLPPGTGLPQRVHGAFVDDHEVHRVVEQLKAMGPPNYVEGLLEGGTEDDGESAGGDGERSADGEKDPLYDQAVDVVLKNKRASISLVQRHLRIGYNRSARLLEAMEKSGLISAMNGQGNRDILAPRRDQD